MQVHNTRQHTSRSTACSARRRRLPSRRASTRFSMLRRCSGVRVPGSPASWVWVNTCGSCMHTRWAADVATGVNAADTPAFLAKKVATHSKVAACVGLHVGEQSHPRHGAPAAPVIWLVRTVFATANVFATHLACGLPDAEGPSRCRELGALQLATAGTEFTSILYTTTR